ncbi:MULTISPECIES: helix-turn-helix domain-containing protein [Klebsiella pneumoniae complex]|uniref:helix-turn-helix domain-containing protein n=1 Tax=Klebsiella pneumoniae complex TaxID=3390273 RepID=UPI0006513F1D|nr:MULTISPECIES: helix-turn-helix domain-containing protein [Klebsiella]HCF6508692.1 helix-turn-helix domain-containing protein [Klebsiella quasipneumoniae subsp. similipneumoniae]EKZ9766603.1 helix-turn-helix domain-containing protein [Klebsiella variicola]MCD5797309.1 helix-turn-helix domain-containing protein [Klebsiella pneumoniae]MCD5833270.1 helix-turn-helix domain-containing protein [Klebsiella pneumoniae]MCD5931320.1 helix-turn-helix domain-containing protein [Klebsiella pneumoniae]
MKTLAEEIGERIKALRTEKGMSQGQLAKLCGWSGASRVANYEYGTRNVGVDDALSLAKALGTTPVMILFGEQSDPSNWLTDKQKKVLSLFNQLPEAEQERMIDTFELRLKEIDEYVEKYLRGRYNPT